MVPHIIIMGMPADIIIVICLQHCIIMSFMAGSIGMISHFMPASVMVQVILHIITGIGMPIMPFIIGIIEFIMGIIAFIGFIIGIMAGIAIAFIFRPFPSLSNSVSAVARYLNFCSIFNKRNRYGFALSSKTLERPPKYWRDAKGASRP
jgi:hypothetical protein